MCAARARPCCALSLIIFQRTVHARARSRARRCSWPSPIGDFYARRGRKPLDEKQREALIKKCGPPKQELKYVRNENARCALSHMNSMRDRRVCTRRGHREEREGDTVGGQRYTTAGGIC